MLHLTNGGEAALTPSLTSSELTHRRRNFGIMIAFLFGLMALYLTSSEYISEAKSKGEIKLYPRKRVPKSLKPSSASSPDDVEGSAGAPKRKASDEKTKQEVHIPASSADFHFEGLTYDIPVKGGTRRLLDEVDGWVKVRAFLFSCPSRPWLTDSTPSLALFAAGHPDRAHGRQWRRQDDSARCPRISCHHGRHRRRHPRRREASRRQLSGAAGHLSGSSHPPCLRLTHDCLALLLLA